MSKKRLNIRRSFDIDSGFLRTYEKKSSEKNHSDEMGSHWKQASFQRMKWSDCMDWRSNFPSTGSYKVPPQDVISQMTNCYYSEEVDNSGWWCNGCPTSGYEASKVNMIQDMCAPWWVFSGDPSLFENPDDCAIPYYTPPRTPYNVTAYPDGISNKFIINWNDNNTSKNVTYNIYGKIISDLNSQLSIEQSICDLDESNLIISGLTDQKYEDIVGKSFDGIKCYKITVVDKKSKYESDFSNPVYSSKCINWETDNNCRSCCKTGMLNGVKHSICTHEYYWNCEATHDASGIGIGSFVGTSGGINSNCFERSDGCNGSCVSCYYEQDSNVIYDDCGIYNGNCFGNPSSKPINDKCYSCSCPEGYDDCGICGGLNNKENCVGNNSCEYMDCNGECHGNKIVDICGECGGDGESYWCGINCGGEVCDLTECHESDIECQDCDGNYICGEELIGKS